MTDFTLQDAIVEAEGAMFRFMKSGNHSVFPCGVRRELSVMGKEFLFQIQVSRKGNVEIYLDYFRGRENSASWKLEMDKDGKWESHLYCGGETINDDEWEIDGIIDTVLRVRNKVK